jgi:hypothetical protein
MKLIKITRNDAEGSYIERFEKLPDVIDGEIISGDQEVGTSVTLTIVEMSEEEYLALPEFMGW